MGIEAQSGSRGSPSGVEPDVDILRQQLVALPQSVNSTNSTRVGYTFIAAGPNNRALQSIGPMGRLATGVQTMEFFDPVDGASINPHVWTSQAVTQTIVQSTTTGYLGLNAGAITTINTSSQISSIKQMQLINTFVPSIRMLSPQS